MMRQALAIVAMCLLCLAARGEPQTRLLTASLASLYPPQKAAGLAQILPVDQEVRWRVRVPAQHDDVSSGVLVFVHPHDSGEPRSDWLDVLERRNLIWISADASGNDVPANRRMLMALMGLDVAQRDFSVDPHRRYIAGMSGGGRVASATITSAPQLFDGAIYIVGVDFWNSFAATQVERIAANRYVFITGARDFNREPTRRVYRRYRDAGVQQVLLMDLAGLGHEYPGAAALDKALGFLDTGK